MNTTTCVTCVECGHLHYTPAGYIECPIEGCNCEGQRAYAAASARSGRAQRVSVLVTVEPDLEQWAAEYGLEPGEVAGDVRSFLIAAVLEAFTDRPARVVRAEAGESST